MTRTIVAIVADDLTGAADTGVAFLTGQRTVSVCWADGSEGAPLGQVPEVDVLAVTTGSRGRTADAAAHVVAQAVRGCRSAGARVLYKKIDSLLRGHVAVETAAALAAWGDTALAIVAPAFPATGRTTMNGRQCRDGDPLPGVPIPDLFAAVAVTARHASLAVVRDGGLAAWMATMADERASVIVCDAETDDDLRGIAEAGLAARRSPIWVGSGGLARAVASALEAPGPRVRTSWRAGLPVLTVVGSMSPLARAQALALVADRMHHVTFHAPDLEAGGAAIREKAADVESRLRSGDDVIVTMGDAVSLRGSDDASLMTRLGEALLTCAPLAGTVVLTGGDTATGVLRVWGVDSLRLDGEFEPGVVLATTQGARAWPVVTKSGSFGDPATLVRLRHRLRAAATVR